MKRDLKKLPLFTETLQSSSSTRRRFLPHTLYSKNEMVFSFFYLTVIWVIFLLSCCCVLSVTSFTALHKKMTQQKQGALTHRHTESSIKSIYIFQVFFTSPHLYSDVFSARETTTISEFLCSCNTPEMSVSNNT